MIPCSRSGHHRAGSLAPEPCVPGRAGHRFGRGPLQRGIGPPIPFHESRAAFGRLLLGSVGAMDHYEYRAVGDIVNTATRLEGLNKHLGTRILVSADVLQGLDGLLTRELGAFLLAGKSRPVAGPRADRAGRPTPRRRTGSGVLSLPRLSPPTGGEPGPRRCGSGSRCCARTEATMGRADFYLRWCETHAGRAAGRRLGRRRADGPEVTLVTPVSRIAANARPTHLQ